MKFRAGMNKDIEPDEIFLDSSNLSSFNTHQFEGWIEKPLPKKVIVFAFVFFLLVVSVFVLKIWSLQVKHGESFAIRSESNSLKKIAYLPERGVIYDRNDNLLAWNEKDGRRYTDKSVHVALGYLGYPSKEDIEKLDISIDSKEMAGKEGAEKIFNEYLRGIEGVEVVEVNARGEIQSENIFDPGVKGGDVKLSLDVDISNKFSEYISSLAKEKGFQGGAGVMMDVNTGEIVAMASYPEYDSNALIQKDEEKVGEYLKDKRMPFMNRVVSGLYVPGSIMKPIFALAALNEGIIKPEKSIYSSGSISIPNPYSPDKPTVFKDWKAHGWVDMKKAIAFSSDVYFYAISGGYEDQKGIGILNIEKYSKMFGFGTTTGFELQPEKSGNIPSPEWKERIFDGEKWSLGNTYHSGIGQYGFQVTPIQVVRAISAIANGGKVLKPTIIKQAPGAGVTIESIVEVDSDKFDVIKEGMRDSVLEGTSKGINFSQVEIAGKTGTAELGVSKKFVNSWNVGFFPYKDPKYAFTVVMEKGPVENTMGGVYVMNQLFNWMFINKPEFFK
ncbi:MAG: penicillin-binding transpeptidase domain-containing protein [bacterium]